MKAYILTGLSGAGKTVALRFMEDLGLLCVDNLPPAMVPKILEAYSNTSVLKHKAIAIAVDIRSGNLFDAKGVLSVIEDSKRMGYSIETIFLEASEAVLVNRYKETRREHPLIDETTGIDAAIAIEKERLAPLREKADYLIDTSNFRSRSLLKRLKEIIVEESKDGDGIKLRIISFGFKRGVPDECDLVFDVRIIQNPFYIPSLSRHTGLDKDVSDFVLNNDISQTFMNKLVDFLHTFIPCYINEGKNRLVIGIGCTGGAHRSVAMSEELCKRLMGMHYNTKVVHRDLELEQALWKNLEI
ncbi:MAG: RNase adapter RapZ [Eubacteriales bacterium]|nr:RNase adapter RapZ [Eubacteriales bacterium]